MKTQLPDLIKALPATLRIGHLTYRLEFHMGLRDEEDGTPMMGCFRNRDMKIQIDAALSGPLIADTMFHEITHAFFEVNGIPRKRLDEEQVAMAMGCAWAQFSQANPGVLSIMEKLACA